MTRLILCFSFFFSLIAMARTDSADHECRVSLRHANWNHGVSKGWGFAVDVKENLPTYQVYVQWRSETTGWQHFRLSSYNHPHQKLGFRSYVGFLPQETAQAFKELDVVVYAVLSGNRLYDHNFEKGDLGFIRLNKKSGWQYETSACK